MSKEGLTRIKKCRECEYGYGFLNIPSVPCLDCIVYNPGAKENKFMEKMKKIKKGFEITNVCSIIKDFDNFVNNWLKMVYDDVVREMTAKGTIDRNKIGIDFKIYEIRG